MKSMILYLVLVLSASALPSAAQTGGTQVSISPQMMQALQAIHRYSGQKHITPQDKARTEAVLARLNEMEHAGAKALQDGDFATAEADFRESIKVSPLPETHYELGEALAGQGRVTEAIEAYRVGIYGPPYTVAVLNDVPIHGLLNPSVRDCAGAVAAEAWMKYSLLLSQTDQGAEAVAIYKKALIRVPEANRLGMSLSLGTDTPEPAAFQAAAHVALGLCATWVSPDHDRAMTEFDAALRLRPASPLTNYYYGYGWQHLDRKGTARAATAAQAQAALQQAAASGGEVKKAAEEALAGFK